jgi:hypothetical protein
MRIVVLSAVLGAVLSGHQGLVHAGWFGPSTYEECVLAHIKDARTNVAVSAVAKMCRAQFPNVFDQFDPATKAAIDKLERESRPRVAKSVVPTEEAQPSPSQAAPASSDPPPRSTGGLHQAGFLLDLPPQPQSASTQPAQNEEVKAIGSVAITNLFASGQHESLILQAQFEDWMVLNSGNLFFIAATNRPISQSTDSFGVVFDKEQQCKYTFGIFSTNDVYATATPKVFFKIESRIDAGIAWSVHHVPLNVSDKSLFLKIIGTDEFMRQLATGKQLSIRSQLVSGGSVWEELFSLRGANYAMFAAHQACIDSSLPRAVDQQVQTEEVKVTPVATTNVSASAQPESPIVTLARFKDWTVINRDQRFGAMTNSLAIPGKEGFAVVFDKEQQCKYRFVISSMNGVHAPATPQVFFDVGFVVDANGIWKSNHVPLNVSDQYLNLQIIGSDGPMRQIATGKQLRFGAARVDNGSMYQDRFSLSGATRAIQAAYQACMGINPQPVPALKTSHRRQKTPPSKQSSPMLQVPAELSATLDWERR